MRKFIVEFDASFYEGLVANDDDWRLKYTLKVPAFKGGAIEVKR